MIREAKRSIHTVNADSGQLILIARHRTGLRAAILNELGLGKLLI